VRTRVEVAGDFVEVEVSVDPVALRWTWRGRTRMVLTHYGLTHYGAHWDTEAEAEVEATRWQLAEARSRAAQWLAVAQSLEAAS
jgi:hypothetical protein